MRCRATIAELPLIRAPAYAPAIAAADAIHAATLERYFAADMPCRHTAMLIAAITPTPPLRHLPYISSMTLLRHYVTALAPLLLFHAAADIIVMSRHLSRRAMKAEYDAAYLPRHYAMPPLKHSPLIRRSDAF